MAVPVIDISGERARVVEEVGRACREIGFLTVIGHGVPEELVAQTAAAARAFFDRPADEKLALADGDPTPGLPAYRPLRSESLAATLGQAAPGDLKESLDWGPAVPGFAWPARPPELRRLCEEYFAALGGLGERLRRLFALALDLPEDWFEDKFSAPSPTSAATPPSLLRLGPRPAASLPPLPSTSKFRGHSSSLRFLNYPDLQGEVEPGQLRAGAHTDYGCMTILRTESAPGGLQVQTRSGDWLDVDAVPGSFVVNLGDMMARWTNDRWPATLHRVAVPPPDRRLGSRRQTIVFFHDPRADAVIECIPGCGTPRYEPVTALEHVQAKAARALA